MSMKLYSETDIEKIAEAIREPNGSSTTYKVREMATGINNLVDTLISYIPHTVISGNPLNINSIPLKPKELEIVGDSKQETTTGANKMKFNERTSTYLNYKCDSKGNVTMFGTLTSTVGLGYNLSSNYVSLTTGTYTLKLKGNSKNIVFSFLGYRINGSESDIKYTFTINSAVSNFQVMQNPVENTNINANYRITLASGTVGTDEFYTNEIASPNSEYPQEINVVKSTNEVINYNISDGTNIKTIPLNIGTTEFCKLTNGVADKLWVDLRTGQYGKTGNVSNKYTIPTGSTTITINDMKSNGSIISSIGGTVSGQTITFSSASPENAYLYYEMATPTTAVLGTLSKENLAKLVMYAGTNNISIDGYDNNGAEPVIEIDYYTQV